MAMQTAVATFTGAEDDVDVAWPAMVGDFGIATSTTVTDGEGPTKAWLTNRTASGCKVNVASRFSGSIDLVIYDR